MFERYTERARRGIFFARYEASQVGGTSITPEHLLIGLMREDPNLIARFSGNRALHQKIRDDVVARLTFHEKVPANADLPMSEEGKHVFAYAAEEAERLNHRHIGTEHLFLGILRIEESLAARTLVRHGLRLDAVRAQLAQYAGSPEKDEAASRFPDSSMDGKVLSLKDAIARVPTPEGKRFAELFKHGTLSVEIYAPKETDPQTPHTRDEAYIVVSGSGEFVFGNERVSFSIGDFLFAPARTAHRFENFTDDLVVWVIFWGPEGGE